MTSTGMRTLLVALAVAIVGAVCLVLLTLGSGLAIPDESGRAVDVAPVVVTPAPVTSPADPVPTPEPAPTPAPTPSESPDDSDGATVVPGPEPVEVGDDSGGDGNRDDDDDRDDEVGGGSGRDHPEDD